MGFWGDVRKDLRWAHGWEHMGEAATGFGGTWAPGRGSFMGVYGGEIKAAEGS